MKKRSKVRCYCYVVKRKAEYLALDSSLVDRGEEVLYVGVKNIPRSVSIDQWIYGVVQSAIDEIVADNDLATLQDMKPLLRSYLSSSGLKYKFRDVKMYEVARLAPLQKETGRDAEETLQLARMHSWGMLDY